MLVASGGLYFPIYITVYSPKLIIFVYWTQLLKYLYAYAALQLTHTNVNTYI